ncbi:high-osmolarity-induced transcription factor [Fusarium beomiforme]|uniref:High-osmolarity-induced transcription factor n=1 Tax=Fusarium beomiforme TaxID=44412 RepID=A0A9P5AH31_9HYPO|nr:high-osmolarity-induced transcription factor [Fusarium beomiforme]
MLISPNETPTPSARSASEGPHRRSASELCNANLPIRGKVPDPRPTREEAIDRAVEGFPFSLARTVVNMQECYASELEAERHRTEELANQNEEMMRRMGEMERRLQMHVVLMDGFVGFMRDVKEGKFAGAGSAELEIARAFGGEHLEAVRGLVADNRRTVQQSVEQPANEMVLFDDGVDVPETVPVIRHVSFDELPSTPDLEASPVRSSGRRAPKRKKPTSKASSSNEATNTGKYPKRADLSNGEGDDHDYAPDPEVEDDNESGEESEEEENDSDDEMEDIPNAPATPSPSHSDGDLEGVKTRYSAPRSVAYRYANGPPGRKFKYHRMPKTAALVWQEWKQGSHSNPSIQSLEERYNTKWRMGTLQERKYASNYVGVRQKIVRKVEEMIEEEGLTAQQACDKRDERVDGRMQLLMTGLRKNQDPLVVIPKRKHSNTRFNRITMCYIQVIHMTPCDTRRPAIINAATGETVYHPLEPPQHCEHYHPYRSTPCPYHGECCSPGQIFVMHKGPGINAAVAKQPIEDWNGLEERTDIYAFEEDIRCEFFDLGARMFELAGHGDRIVEYLMANQATHQEEEVNLFLEHGELYEQWKDTHQRFISVQDAWESLAAAGCMECCPAWLRAVHPWTECFQTCPVIQKGFRQFEGIPFSFIENLQNQDDILRFHPYYTQQRPQRQAVTCEAPWRSPARPHERSPEVRERGLLRSLPYPGEWAVVFDEIARRESEAETSRRPNSALSWTSGPMIPPWIIPYGEEPEMNWKNIDWNPPTVRIPDRPMSPKTVPLGKEATRVEPPRESCIDPKDVAAVDLFGNNPEVAAGDLFATTVQPPEQQIPRISWLSELQNIATEALQNLKRRLSSSGCDDRETYRESKRQRISAI